MPKDKKEFLQFDRALNGKLITYNDPVLLAREDFSRLRNFRYNDTGIEGVKGMSEINDAVIHGGTYRNPIEGFHFHTDFPAVEDHIFVETEDLSSGVRTLYKSDNTAAIPLQDTFTIFQDDMGGVVNMSEAPEGNMIVCDGSANYIWSGDEHRVGAVITSTADITTTVTNAADVTDKMVNSNVDENITFGLDGYTKALYHFDGANNSTTITDSSGGTHSGTCVDNACIDTGYYRFGGSSLFLDGTTDHVTVAGHADFNFGTGDFTIEGGICISSYNASNGNSLCSHYEDDNNYWYLVYNNVSYQIQFKSVVGGAITAYYVSSALNLVPGTYYHIAVARAGTSLYLFVDGYQRTFLVSTAIASNSVGTSAGTLYIGATKYSAGTGIVWHLAGHIDELRISKGIARWTASFVAPTGAYASYRPYMIVGSTRALSGVKLYITSGNTITTATITAQLWSGSAWLSMATTDNTSGLETTGTIVWGNSDGVAKMRYFNGYFLYWYKISISAGESQIYQITTTPSFQEYKDSWDGSTRPVLGCFKNTTTNVFEDNTMNVMTRNFLGESDISTFMNVNGMTSSQAVIVGFTEKTTAIAVFIPSSFGNDHAATLTVSYWNGSEWKNVLDLVDGTSDGTNTLKQSGVISWRSDYSTQNEVTKIISNSYPLYYYMIVPSATLAEKTYIDQFTGIPAPKHIKPFKIPLSWQGRLWLLNEKDDKTHYAFGSPFNLPESMNGSDFVEMPIGDNKEITAATTMFTRYGGSIFDNMVICKRNATYLIDGYSPATYKIITISEIVGCVAPKTMKTCDMNYEVGPGINRHVAIWQAAHGIVMFDGNAITSISEDIKNFFDSTSTDYISVSHLDRFYGFFDSVKNEYHWCFTTGTNTILDREMVYDLKRKKWFEIVRGINNNDTLQCGFNVIDLNGICYTYGGITNHVMRLENTLTMNGSDITYDLISSDNALSNSMAYESEARKIKLCAKYKATADPVNITWYADGKATGVPLTAIPQGVATRRYYDAIRSFTAKGTTHAYRITTTTDKGFDPLFVTGVYRVIRLETLD
jgi:hypothetical protein